MQFILMMNVKVKIKIEILKKGTSGAAIARKVGVDRTAIYHVISGRSKSKRLRKAIAEALDMTVLELWPDEGSYPHGHS